MSMPQMPQQNQTEEKDANVMQFMQQLVQEKHGNQVELAFLESEADKLYNEFGENLVAHFEPMLTDAQKMEFDKIVKEGSDKDSMLTFLMDSIPNLEEKIIRVLLEFKDEYLQSPLDQ